MLHYPTLPCIAMHFTCNMQCTSDFPTLQCIAPHFQSTGFRFVVQCVTSDAMQCVISAWRSKYIPIPQPGQCSAARLKSLHPTSPPPQLIYMYAGFGSSPICREPFLCLPVNKVIAMHCPLIEMAVKMIMLSHALSRGTSSMSKTLARTR